MPSPHENLTPAAYARMGPQAQEELLFEFLEDLIERLAWVDDELARLGHCSVCAMAEGEPYPHECRRQRWQ